LGIGIFPAAFYPSPDVATLFQRIQQRLERDCAHVQDWVEDRFVPATVRRIKPEEFLKQQQLQRFVWNEVAAEFESEVGMPMLADRQFLYSFAEARKPARFLEIGTWRGGTAAVVKTVSPQTHVTTINYPDPEVVNNPLKKDEIGRAFLRRNLPVELIWADSADLPKLGLQPFDMIFVDGDHRQEPALRDMENCWALLNPGGWMLLHDFVQSDVQPRTSEQRWVVRAHGQFSARHRAEIKDQFQFEGSWIAAVQKRGA
jgi:predicted O-methyltransferase YrrM